MHVIRGAGTDRLDFGGGRVVPAPGPVLAVQEWGEVVAVLTEWIDRRVDQTLRCVQGDNLYGFGREGNLRWRVHRAEPHGRPLLLTGFLEDTPGLRLHEAYGWWVAVDPASGRVTGTQWIG